MQTFSFSPSNNSVDEGKWLPSATFFGTTIFLFKITNENKSSTNSTPGHWNSEDGEEFIKELINLLKLGSENDIELHVKVVGKRGTSLEIEYGGYN